MFRESCPHSMRLLVVLIVAGSLPACASRATAPSAAAPEAPPQVAEATTPEEPVVAPAPAPAPATETASAATSDDDEDERQLRRRRQACDAVSEDNVLIVDDTQALLTETSCRAALWLDGLFGGDDNLEAAQRTHGYLETSVRHSQFEGTDLRTRLRVRFELPNIKQRLSAFVGREDEEEFVQDRSEGFALRSQFPRVADQDEWLAGLGYALPDSRRLRTSVRVGAASLRDPRVFVQGRLHYNAYADEKNVVYVRATPFWNSRIGFGVTTALDYSHVLRPWLLARWSTVGTRSERTEGVNWLSAVILYQNLREQRAIAYEAFVRGETQAPEPLYEYGGRTIYRHPLVMNRLYGEFVLGYSFPRTDPNRSRNGSYEIGFGLELPFGQASD